MRCNEYRVSDKGEKGKNFFLLLVTRYLLLVTFLFCGFSANADVFDKAKDAVKQYALRNNPEWRDGKVAVTLKSAEKFFEKYASDKNVTFEIPKQYEISKVTANMILPIAAYKDGKEVGRTAVIVRIEVYKDVVAAVSKISRRSEISDDDLDIKTKDVALYPVRYFTDKDLVAGKIANNNISEGTVLMDWMVKDMPVVSKGSKVKIVALSENIMIESTGVALADGQLNDIIKVRRSDSKEVVEAQVISPEIVEVKI